MITALALVVVATTGRSAAAKGKTAEPAPERSGGDRALEVAARATGPRPKPKEVIEHRGFEVDANVGALGCFADTCAQRHAAAPGGRVGGFIGGNIRGVLSLGFAGGWGMLRPKVTPGVNALSLYGIDVEAFNAQFDTPAGNVAPIDFTPYTVDRAEVVTAQAGPLLRLHFVPRGRMDVWVGSGAYYNYVSSKYQTPAGAMRMDLHGLAVPVQAGLGVYVIKNLALTANFDYMWTWYALARVRSPQDDIALPVSALDDIARDQGSDFSGELPQFWTVAFGLHARV